VECLKMGKKVTFAGWNREDIIKGPGELAIKKFSPKEVADLEAEAKRIAAEKAAAKKAAAKEGAKKPAKEGAASEGANNKAARKKAAVGEGGDAPKTAEKPAEGTAASKEGGAT
jgi:hypothetical protein